jgi:type VI protein secretion system component VasF
MKNMYKKAMAKATVAVKDAGLSDAVVTVIILLAGVVCAIFVYYGARTLISNTNEQVFNQAETLVSDMGVSP